MRRRSLLGLALAAVAAPVGAAEGPRIGALAPPFETLDEHGARRSLSEFAGRIVVLEWTNNGCPYTEKHYGHGAMQRLQQRAVHDGVVWLTVVSSAPGFQGYLTATQAMAWKRRSGAASSAILLDPSGLLGRAYQARTTPHMFIIDRAGRLAYMGGIDDQPSTDPATLRIATNHVAAALADLRAGRSVSRPVTPPYGCGVKYARVR